MSVQITSLVWLLEFPSAGRKLVALYLADCADDLGRCWPAAKTIAARCGLSRDTVKEVIADLEASGLIAREPQFRRDGSQSSSITRFDLAKLEAESGKARAAMVKEAQEDRALSLAHAKPRGGGVENPPGGEGGKTPPPPKATIAPPQPTIAPAAPILAGGEGSFAPRGENHPGGRGEKTPPGGEKTTPQGGGKPPPLEPSRNRKVTKTPCSPPVGDDPNRAAAAVRVVIQSFAIVYQRRFRKQYLPDPKKDVKAAQALLAAGLDAPAIAARFEEATRTKGFWCSKVTTLPMLAERWNEVGGEIANVGNPAAMGGKADGQDTAQEWAQSIAEPPKP